MIKYTATIFIAAILSISLVTAAYAQNQNATSLQIQLVPKIQRGHQQQLTIYAVDNQGNQVNGSGEIISSIENAQGTLVGPKTVYTESGEHIAYKVGPNTRPQNITINSCLSSGEICAEQSYYVFPKGQGQTQPPIVIPSPVPTPEPEPQPPVTGNESQDGEITLPANETEVTMPENGTDVTLNDTGEAQPLPPISNQTQTQNQTEPQPPVLTPPGQPPILTNQTGEPVPFPPQPEIPNEVNETIPIPVPPNITTGNETIPVQLPINETQTPSGQNETVDIPALPVEPPQQPTGDQENQTEQLPDEIPASNDTDTIPIELPINSSTGNETIPIPPIDVTPPSQTNATQNATVEEPQTPSNGGGGGETQPPLNATDAFDQLQNTTAIQDEKIDQVRDSGNDTSRGELKALVANTAQAIGEAAPMVANATNDQLQILQNSFISGSEAIDEIINPEAQAPESENENGNEDDQGENEQ